MERESGDKSQPGLRLRLSILAAIVFSVPGAFLPGYSTHLEHGLHFSPLEVSICAATQGIASLLASLFGQLADRVLPIKVVISLCAFGICVAILGLILSTAPVLVFAFTFLYWLLTIPTWVMVSALLFTLLKNPEKEFGPVRMVGTVGWMAAGWSLVPLFALFPTLGQGTGAQFGVALVLAAILAIYAMTLPNQQPLHPPGRSFAPSAAIRLLWGKSFALYSLSVFGICISQPFVVQGTPLLLRELGIGSEWLVPALTLSQVTEALLALLLAGIILRMGLKGTMGMGLVAWCLSLTILSVSQTLTLALASLPLNGFVITLFLISGSIWINSRVPDDLRASVQTVIVTIQGMGMCLGHLLMGLMRQAMQLESAAEELRWCFLVGGVLNGMLALLFWWGFDPAQKPANAPALDVDYSSPQTSSSTSSAT